MGVEERNNFYDLFNATGITLNRNEKRFLDKRIKSFNKSIEAALLFQEDESALRKIIENLDNLEPFEEPDCCLLIDENEIVAIEMFQFDCGTSSSRKGSKFQKRISEILKTAQNKKHYEELYNVQTTLKDYRNALIHIFQKHYANIASYKNRVSNNWNIDESKVKMCFFIIDATPCGSIYNKQEVEQKVPHYYMPIFDSAFVNELQNSLDIDYLITCHNEDFFKSIRFICLSKEHLEYIKQNIVKNIDESDFYCWDVSLITQSQI